MLCKPANTLCKLANTLCKLAYNLCKPANILCKPANTLSKPANILCKPADTLCKPANTLCKPANTLCKLANTLCKLANNLCKPANNLCKPADTLCKPANTVCKPADKLCKPANTLCKLWLLVSIPRFSDNLIGNGYEINLHLKTSIPFIYYYPSWCSWLLCFLGHVSWGGSVGTLGFCLPWWASLAWCLQLPCLLDCTSYFVHGGGCMLLAETAQQTFLFPNFWGWPILEKFNKDRCLCGTKFGILTLTFNFFLSLFSSTEPKAHRWAYSIGRYPSICLPSSTFSNIDGGNE